MASTPDDGFTALQAYDGYEFVFESGHVARFEIRRNEDRPVDGAHPYRYSFTLHDPDGRRILGFDNAHPITTKSGARRKRSETPDHWHRTASDKGRPYRFVSPQQLLTDFMEEVERALRDRGASADIQDMRKTP